MVAMPFKASATITNIAVIDNQFVPSTVTIQQNDSIAWIWPATNNANHSTTGLGLWDSGVLGPGSFYTNTFFAAQTFPFHCTVHGNIGMVGSVQVNPTNPVAPTFVTQPKSQSVLAGDDATFTASATGTQPLSYQWLFQGSNIAGATGTAFTINNVKDTNAGNYSVSVSNSVGVTTSTNAVLTVIPTSVLVVTINGNGTVKPNLNGKLLGIGQTYTMTATPAAGYVFSNWSGTISTNTQKLTFQMQSNMVLQANFAPGQFVGAKGTYRGLFYETGGVALASSGGFTLTTTVKGTFSGSLQMASGRSVFNGHFETNGTAEVVVKRRTGNLTLDLQVDLLTGDSTKIIGNVTDGTFNAPLSGDRAVFNIKTNPAPQAPRYTLVVEANPAATNSPQGDGFATVTVNKSGVLQFSGTLADGTKVSQSSAVSSDGEWPMFVAFPGGRGSMLSWVNVGTTSTNAVTGDVTWIRTPSSKAYGSGGGSTKPRLFADGFMVVTTLTGFPYVRPASGTPVLGFTDGRAVFAGTDLSSSITNDIVVSATSRVTNLSSNKLTLSFNLPTGTFRGTVADPNLATKHYTFSGVALQGTNVGRGYFLGATQSGTVLVEAR